METFFVDGSVVAKLCNLRPEQTPKNLMQKNPIRNEGDFDPNVYFSVLIHLAMKEGYTLDYVYDHMNGFGGYPSLYAPQTEVKTFDTLIESRDHRCDDLSSYLVADGTPDSFFQLAVFNLIAGQFYLSWHALYNDATVITSLEDKERPYSRLSITTFLGLISQRRKLQLLGPFHQSLLSH